MMAGVTRPNTTITSSSATSGQSCAARRPRSLRLRVSQSVAYAPMPLNSSSENKTTESEYVGWPRKSESRCICAISSSKNPRPIAAKKTASGSVERSARRLVVSRSGTTMQSAVTPSTATLRLNSTRTGRAM